jgi:rhodanese-related sulfurtransferase
MNKKYLMYFGVIFLLLLITVLFFSMQKKEIPAGFETVSVEEAREMIEKDEVFILDVRTPAEFNSSHLEGATLIPVTNSGGSNLSPDQLLEARINEVPQDKKILVYCRTGHTSVSASNILVAASYSDVYNMEGGITAWTGAGYPVVS